GFFTEIEVHLFPGDTHLLSAPFRQQFKHPSIKLLSGTSQQLQAGLGRLVRLQHTRLPTAEHLGVFSVLTRHAGPNEWQEYRRGGNKLCVATEIDRQYLG